MRQNNAKQVLLVVKFFIKTLETKEYKWERRLSIREQYDRLSIFDWWNETLSISQLKDMKKFIEEAIKLGYTGYVCFKVGAAGCSNGMWAYKEPRREDGYAPDGAFIYKSFVSTYNYWSAYDENGTSITEKLSIEYDDLKTIRQFENAMTKLHEGIKA